LSARLTTGIDKKTKVSEKTNSQKISRYEVHEIDGIARKSPLVREPMKMGFSVVDIRDVKRSHLNDRKGIKKMMPGILTRLFRCRLGQMHCAKKMTWESVCNGVGVRPPWPNSYPKPLEEC
jgi:hypothetical protein